MNGFAPKGQRMPRKAAIRMKSNALRKSIKSFYFTLLSALLMYSLGPSASGTPDPDFVDAAWVSQRTKLTKVAASDGSALLEVAAGSDKPPSWAG